MPTHGAVALVVQEKGAEIGPLTLRCSNHRPVHVCMAPGLPHQCLSEIIQVVPEIASFFKDALSFDLRNAVQYDPQGLAPGVHIDGFNPRPVLGRDPSPAI